MKVLHQSRVADLSPDDVLSRLFELTVVLSEAMSTSLAERGLTTSRAEVLWRLHRDGPVTQRELAVALSVTPRNVTGLVDALEEAGYVTRQPHPSDRRATHVTLTKVGQKEAAKLSRDQELMDERLFGDLTHRERLALVAALDRVLSLLPTARRDWRAA